MNRFTIRKLTVSGGGHQDSIIEFTDGLNLIIGPIQYREKSDNGLYRLCVWIHT